MRAHERAGAYPAHLSSASASDPWAVRGTATSAAGLPLLAAVPSSGDVAISALRGSKDGCLSRLRLLDPVQRAACPTDRSLAAGLSYGCIAPAVRSRRHLHLAETISMPIWNTAWRRCRFRVSAGAKSRSSFSRGLAPAAVEVEEPGAQARNEDLADGGSGSTRSATTRDFERSRPLHPLQSGEAWICHSGLRLAVQQFPALCDKRFIASGLGRRSGRDRGPIW